ncbi:hypothetical protein ABIE44_001805 [Marmoricola sp. OAE513]|uniref:hypothetical protein n=1 Tax=Marmoricola sp. OAE513 TaxID=2817894 RepID=UPI0033977E07
MTDDDRQMLGRADPARSLAPLDATALNELLEDTMGQNEDTNPDGRRKVVLLGAAAAAVVAIAIGVGITLDDDGEPPETGDRPDVTSSTVTELSARPALGKCMVPSPETAANQDVAFEGRVVSVKDGLVTLDPPPGSTREGPPTESPSTSLT